MQLKVDQDHARFKSIIRGKIRQNLKEYISHGELITHEGKDRISIPLPGIELPRFAFGENRLGVGQGDGEEGDAFGASEGDGGGKAGNLPGEHSLEIEVTIEELAKILGEELELPRIEPKGVKILKTSAGKYTGISKSGPESLRHFKRTFKEALKRTIASGDYDPKEPFILPLREDKRYRARKTTFVPQTSAVIFYLMDVSGSMGEEQKELVRLCAFWIDIWIRSHYKNIQIRYITHDANAREVDRRTFYHSRESGGTLISSAYLICRTILSTEYPVDDWNVYVFHFSDGDNWSDEDNANCVRILIEDLLPRINLFGYGQVKSSYGSGQFLNFLDNHIEQKENLVLSSLEDRENILPAIKTFLGKGK